MLLALDLGNTHLTVGVFDDTKLAVEFRIATDHSRTEDEYAVNLLTVLNLYGIGPSSITGAILCSVVPDIDNLLIGAVRKITGQETVQVTGYTDAGMKLAIDHPSQLGADLLVGAVAAAARYGTPCVVWDLGTATTASVVDKDGVFRGGVILPGIRTALRSLVSGTSLLPSIRVEAPDSVIGTNTADCMRSGAVLGNAALIDGMTARIEEELGQPVTMVVTGGLGEQITACCHHTAVYDGRLVLDGLRRIYDTIKEK